MDPTCVGAVFIRPADVQFVNYGVEVGRAQALSPQFHSFFFPEYIAFALKHVPDVRVHGSVVRGVVFFGGDLRRSHAPALPFLKDSLAFLHSCLFIYPNDRIFECEPVQRGSRLNF